VPLQRFLSAKESVYDPGWLPTRIAAYVLGKPLWWALEQLGVVGEEGDGHGEKARTEWWGEYVVLALVERMADAVVAAQARRATGPAAGLYTFEGFRKAFGDVVGRSGMGEMDAKVLVRFLERDRRVVVFDPEVRVLMSGCVLADGQCRGVSSSSLRRMPRQSPGESTLLIGGFWS
jgi:charged multivesicular body protein 7